MNLFVSACTESDVRQQACEFCGHSGIKVFDGVGDNSDNRINVVKTFQEDLDGDACDGVFNPDPDGYTYNNSFPFDASEALGSGGDGVGTTSVLTSFSVIKPAVCKPADDVIPLIFQLSLVLNSCK